MTSEPEQIVRSSVRLASKPDYVGKSENHRKCPGCDHLVPGHNCAIEAHIRNCPSITSSASFECFETGEVFQVGSEDAIASHFGTGDMKSTCPHSIMNMISHFNFQKCKSRIRTTLDMDTGTYTFDEVVEIAVHEITEIFNHDCMLTGDDDPDTVKIDCLGGRIVGGLTWDSCHLFQVSFDRKIDPTTDKPFTHHWPRGENGHIIFGNVQAVPLGMNSSCNFAATNQGNTAKMLRDRLSEDNKKPQQQILSLVEFEKRYMPDRKRQRSTYNTLDNSYKKYKKEYKTYGLHGNCAATRTCKPTSMATKKEHRAAIYKKLTKKRKAAQHLPSFQQRGNVVGFILQMDTAGENHWDQLSMDAMRPPRGHPASNLRGVANIWNCCDREKSKWNGPGYQPSRATDMRGKMGSTTKTHTHSSSWTSKLALFYIGMDAASIAAREATLLAEVSAEISSSSSSSSS